MTNCLSVQPSNPIDLSFLWAHLALLADTSLRPGFTCLRSCQCINQSINQSILFHHSEAEQLALCFFPITVSLLKSKDAGALSPSLPYPPTPIPPPPIGHKPDNAPKSLATHYSFASDPCASPSLCSCLFIPVRSSRDRHFPFCFVLAASALIMSSTNWHRDNALLYSSLKSLSICRSNFVFMMVLWNFFRMLICWLVNSWILGSIITTR